MRFIQRIPITRAVRDALLDAHPGARGDPEYECMLVYLYLPEWRDKETEEAILCREVLARLSGQETQLKGNRFKGSDFIDAFKRDVMPDLDVSGWVPSESCRYVRHAPLKPDVLDLLLEDDITESGDLVYADLGSKYEASESESQRERMKKRGDATVTNAVDPLQERILLYMNGLPTNGFTTAVSKHWPEARERLRQMKEENTLTGGEVWAANMTLYAIATQPQPFYQLPDDAKTVRLSRVGNSLLSLKRELRQIITQDWVEIDLAGSQYAINAWLWEIDELLDFLGGGGHIWTELFQVLGFDHDELKAKRKDDVTFDIVKEALKKASYSSFYGMDRPDVMRKLTLALQALGKEGRIVLNHPFFLAIFKARQRMIEKIEAKGGAKTIFGDFLKTEPNQDAKSILAQQAQAVEMKLLEPAIDLAEAHKDHFTIMLWQEDGFSVRVRDKSRIASWVRRIQKAVDEHTGSMGIPTCLEAEYEQGNLVLSGCLE